MNCVHLIIPPSGNLAGWYPGGLHPGRLGLLVDNVDQPGRIRHVQTTVLDRLSVRFGGTESDNTSTKRGALLKMDKRIL